MIAEALLETKKVTKTYGGIPAIDAVDFDLQQGEVHALVGENGAGKSTLCKVIAGVITMDQGEMLLEGKPLTIESPRDSFKQGISMVFQETSLVPQLTVAQNLVLGRERAFNSVRALRNETRQLLRSLNFNIDPAAMAESLNTAQRQMVEIARAVYNKSRIIILDEPTAALTPEETDHLFYLMNELRGEGVTMIFISHALEEALTHADRISILRNGKKIITDEASRFDRNKLIQHMVGAAFKDYKAKPKTVRKTGARQPILTVENVRMGNMVNNMSFSVYPGEVTGIAGLIGSGRSAVAKVIAGQIKRNFGGGRIYLRGREIRYRIPAQAIHDGIAYVTEDRKVEGLFEAMDATDNIGFGWLAKWTKGYRAFKRNKLKSIAHEWLQKLSIKTLGNENQNVLRLSGGNQQKVVIAKALIQQPELIIFDEPTRGVDVGAIAEIRNIIMGFADGGAGVVVISSYLPEILDISDRILVARGGTIVAEFSKDEATPEKILHAAIH
jgi:simple sugar transport system ATP-binding protein